MSLSFNNAIQASIPLFRTKEGMQLLFWHKVSNNGTITLPSSLYPFSPTSKFKLRINSSAILGQFSLSLARPFINLYTSNFYSITLLVSSPFDALSKVFFKQSNNPLFIIADEKTLFLAINVNILYPFS